MSRILPLPADAISQIRSSKNITSLQDVVLALLENSLDANATKIEVTVDFRRGSCTAEDDGDGIPSAEFGEDGGLGKMYHTSKRLPHFDQAHDLHGFNGTYLTSLASLSLLSITSRRAGSPNQSTLTMHQGKVISRRTSMPSSELGGSIVHGTQVTMRDLFGNMPVRVKQRALTSDNGNDDNKAWHQLKHRIAALLLACPKPCSVRLADSNREDRKVHLAGSHPSTIPSLTRSGLRQLDSDRPVTFSVKDVLPIVFQAGLSLPESRPNWVPVSASAVDITVKGLICLDPAPTKQCQFVSLGVHPCATTSSSGDVYDAINKVFINSSFGAIEDLSDVEKQEKDRRKRDRRYKSDGYTQRQLHTRKGVDRWPMFVLQVSVNSLRPKDTTAGNVSDATLKSIVGVLEATVTQWLVAHHFRPRKRRDRRRNGDQQRPASGSSTRMSSPAESAHAGNPSMRATLPDMRCTASSHPGTAAKRRRIAELAERPHSTYQSSMLPGNAAESPFGLWSRIKSGRESSHRKERDMQRATTAPEGRTESEVVPEDVSGTSTFKLPPIEAGALNATRQRHANVHNTAARQDAAPANPGPTAVSSEDFGSIDVEEMVAAAVEMESRLCVEDDATGLYETCNHETIDWVDPKSQQRYRVNARTGVVLPVRDKPAQTADQSENMYGRQAAAMNTTVSSKGKPLSLARRATPARPENTSRSGTADIEWLPGFLHQWNNPVFVHQEEAPIPVALPDGPAFGTGEACKYHCGHQAQPDDFNANENVVAGAGRLAKPSLRSAKVISQVDRKFILCKVSAHGGNGSRAGETLILVDQHAASERVILEGLLAELCTPVDEGVLPAGVKTAALEKPLRFQVSEKEHNLFHSHKAHFADWGILYTVSQRCEDRFPASQNVRAERTPEHIVEVTHLPPGIAERCTLVPRILIEMLRAEVWAAAETSQGPVKALRAGVDADIGVVDGQQQEYQWLRRIGSCPKGVLDMLKSRACRSAIMFNDELSFQQCGGLMAKLSSCAFPYMCAHGRVSMVPLVDFGGGHGDGGVTFGVGEFGGRDVEDVRNFSAAFEQWMGGGGSSSEIGESGG